MFCSHCWKQKKEEIQVWRHKYEMEESEEELSIGYICTLYLSTVRVLMQKVKVRSKTQIYSREERAKHGLNLARESRWKLSDQSTIEIYDVQGKIIIDNEK